MVVGTRNLRCWVLGPSGLTVNQPEPTFFVDPEYEAHIDFIGALQNNGLWLVKVRFLD